jgi:hypothetical protein
MSLAFKKVIRSHNDLYTGVLPYVRVILYNPYRGYVKRRIIPNAIYKMIFV